MNQSLTCLVLLGFMILQLEGHFTLENSRETAFHTEASNVRFWPIGPDNLLYKRTMNDCLKYAAVKPMNYPANQKITLKFVIGEGAAHTGLCEANLYQGSKWLNYLGNEDNCVSRRQAMDIQLPKAPCQNCVIKIKVVADHLGKDKPEYYDSCVDVNIQATGNVPAAPTAAKVVVSSPPTWKNVRSPSVTVASPVQNQPGSCKENDHKCSSDGKQFSTCAQGNWVHRDVAPGTVCQMVNGKFTIE